MTADPLPFCDPLWTDDWEPGDRPPSAFDLRQAEIRDLKRQRAGTKALWTADTVPTSHYL
ncbi:hypothetical protein OIE75_29480 [Streptomyces sp. NBC_01723]|uniref:hypothetical protein n=1 Tax=Streptomyces sp. NBC_01723 TaxID=2975921 RepID=UPI002E314AFA|nr:hypothetical protein [Streptomyces sp. NBC_01723]